jgi:CDP-diacylglycerol--glycerol-3-phosphate 3-phosphatidyltransferase
MTLKTQETPAITLATKITILRILGVPVFIVLLVYYISGLARGEHREELRLAALSTFLFIAMTDALDGYVARARNEVTQLGRVLDPVADKALVLSGLILLTRPSVPELEPHIPLWFTGLVISRDALQVGGFLLVQRFAGDVEMAPRMSGKIATVLVMMTIIVVLGQWPGPYFDWLVIATTLFIGLSGAQYLFDGMRQLDRGAKKNG